MTSVDSKMKVDEDVNGKDKGEIEEREMLVAVVKVKEQQQQDGTVLVI